jgi:Fur family transcriptional regulator, ferric uptake regulator
VTRAQRAVLAALARDDAFRSAQDIHARLRDGDSAVGLTSVYRALQALADSRAVDVLRTSTGELTYRRCGSDAHHHHLVCTTCGATVEVEAPAIERWVADVAESNGYVVASHTLEVTGTCRSCADL